MSKQTQAQQANGAWVRLHLVEQTAGSNMPDAIEGFLVEETPNSYVLHRVIEWDEDEDEFVEADRMNLISRTYVWRCEILERSPLDDGSEGKVPAYFGDEGGMG